MALKRVDFKVEKDTMVILNTTGDHESKLPWANKAPERSFGNLKVNDRYGFDKSNLF